MSKKSIIKNIKANKPPFVELPDIPDFNDPEINAIAQFEKRAKASGIEIIPVKDKWSFSMVNAYFPNAKKVLDLSKSDVTIPEVVHDIDLLIVKGQLAVAENAAIWLDESNFNKRILPFITQELLIVVEKENIVQNMHQAYKKIKVDATGFGVFIAGPSKTADIEQYLVVGAQGARKMFVVLV